MRVIYDLKNFKQRLKKPIVTIGMFDGFHRGHQYILRKVIARAKKSKGTSLVVTFHPHPLKVLNPAASALMLTSIDHRLELIGKLGIDVCLVITFTKKFSRLSADEFVKAILVSKIEAHTVMVGSAFTFGKGGEGNVTLLGRLGREYGFEVNQVRPIKVEGAVVSSTQIRDLIEEGRLKRASALLNRPVSIFGTVIKGASRGRLLGYPTANIDPHHEIVPPPGVYVVRVALTSGKFDGILNMGTRPTFGSGEPTIEVHIFNFQKSIYGQNIEITFIKKIRDEKKFRNKEKLLQQIRKDEKQAKKLLL